MEVAEISAGGGAPLQVAISESTQEVSSVFLCVFFVPKAFRLISVKWIVSLSHPLSQTVTVPPLPWLALLRFEFEILCGHICR